MMTDKSDLIVQYFGYLILEFGFHIERKVYDPETMGNAIVVFKSSSVGIEIVVDRNQVLITVGDQMDPRAKWLEFSDVLRYFSPTEVAYIDIGQLFNEKRKNHDSNRETWDEVLLVQLSRLSTILRQCCEPILKGDLSMKKEIKEIEEKRVTDFLKKYQK